MKIHYIVKIDTTTTISDSSVGLKDGSFIYSTDGYQIDESTRFEDNTIVPWSCYTDFISMQGIKPSSQSIDIVSSGNYAWASGLNIEFVNVGAFHKDILTIDDVYLTGSKVTFYVVIDNILYSRWVGSVTSYSFDDKKFTIMCGDSHNKENNIITPTNYGYNDTQYIPVVEDVDAVLTHKFIRNYEPTDKAITLWDQTVTGTTPINDEYLSEYYVGGHPNARHFIERDSDTYYLRLNSNETDIVAGMYVKILGDDTYHYIINREIKSDIATDGENQVINYLYTELTIQGQLKPITDYTNFYGYQPDGVSSAISTATKIYDTNTVNISVYSKGLWFAPIEGGYDVVDGKVDATTKDGLAVKLDVKENPDGSLSLLNTNYTSIVKPKSIRYYGTSNDTSIDLGTSTHWESKGTTIVLPQDLNADGVFEDLPPNKDHYFIMEFDEAIESMIPFVIVKNGVFSKEEWYTYANGLNPNVTESGLYSAFGNTPSRTTYYGKYVINDSMTSYSFFRKFDIDCYKVTPDKFFGLVPLLDSDASFSLPNSRYRTSFEIDYNILPFSYIVDVQGAPVTNLPTSEIVGNRIVSTYNGLNSWKVERNTSLDTQYPDSKLNGIDLGGSVETDKSTTGGKIFILRISGSNTDTDTAQDLQTKVFNTDPEYPAEQTFTIDLNKLTFGINSIGLFKNIVIDSIADVTIKTHDESTDTYNKLLSRVSQTTVDIPTRRNWYVGGQIAEDTNRFNIITSLCQQGMVGGFTNRFGIPTFKAFLEQSSTAVIHDDYYILDNSISDFSATDLSKIYNSFAIKYHKIKGEYTQTMGVYNVDKDSFPLPTDINPIWGTAINCTGKGLALNAGLLQVNKTNLGSIIDILDGEPNNLYRVDVYGGEGTVIFTDVVFNSETSLSKFYSFTVVGGTYTIDPLVVISCPFFYENQNDAGILWKTFVVGIDSYPDAEALWNTARRSYIANKVIRTIPSSIGDLEYAIDLNAFNGIDKTNTDEYAYNYFKLMVEWCSRAKLQVKYKIPLDSVNVGINLLDNVLFSDPIITPTVGEYGKGWVTSLQLDPKASTLNLGVTFEPDFFIPPTSIQKCYSIIETGTTQYNIIESGNNQYNIYEGNCH